MVRAVTGGRIRSGVILTIPDPKTMQNHSDNGPEPPKRAQKVQSHQKQPKSKLVYILWGSRQSLSGAQEAFVCLNRPESDDRTVSSLQPIRKSSHYGEHRMGEQRCVLYRSKKQDHEPWICIGHPRTCGGRAIQRPSPQHSAQVPTIAAMVVNGSRDPLGTNPIAK